MGSWAIGSLENDTALDWLSELVESPDANIIRITLSRIKEPLPELSKCIALEEARAAAEVVACWLGHPPPEPKRAGLVIWAQQHLVITPEIIALAQDAAVIIMQQWALLDYRNEADMAECLASISNLQNRLLN